MELKNKNILVLGLSISGISVAKYAIKHGANVILTEKREQKPEDTEKILELNDIYCDRIAFGNNIFIKNGDQLAYSYDGEKWFAASIIGGGNSAIAQVFFNNNKFIALSETGKCLHSYDGINWQTYNLDADLPQDNWSNIIYGDGKYLQIRKFDEKVARKVYEKQHHHCPYCVKENNMREYAFKEMHADHIKPWSKGGKTEEENCQMLCASHNESKGNRWQNMMKYR